MRQQVRVTDVRPSVPHAEAAVDGDDGAGDVRGGVAGQPGDDAGDLLGRGQPAERDLADDGSALRSSASSAVMSVSMKPGATTLAVMPTAAELAGDRPGHADEPGLRRRVVDLAAGSGQADDRADEDDAARTSCAASPFAHRRTTRKVPARLASTTDSKASSDIVSSEPVAGDPGVGDEHLDRPELLLDLGRPPRRPGPGRSGRSARS